MTSELILVKESGERVDKYISVKLNTSREGVKRLIANGDILVNNKIVKPNYKINNGDEILVSTPKPLPTEILPQKLDLDIVFEDDDIIMINKANDIVVHPSPGHYKNTLLNGLVYHCGNLSCVGGVERPGVVHRIDKQTTGLIVFAKNDHSHNHLAKQFKEKTNKRVYRAIVHGVIPNDTGMISAPVGRNPNSRKTFEVRDTNSKEAQTTFRVIERFANHSYIELELKTGRTHQIRVHMKYINHPVLGDEVYGLKKHKDSFGQYLHAYSLGIKHPRTKEWVKFKAQLPQEFSNKLKEIRKDV